MDKRQLTEFYKRGEAAKELQSNELLSSILNGLVDKYHNDLAKVDMAADVNGNNTKLAVIAYLQARAIRDAINDQVRMGEAAQDELMRIDRREH